jgi:hypothetical protein
MARTYQSGPSSCVLFASGDVFCGPSRLGSAAGAGGAALKCTSLVLAQSAPDASVLTRLKGPLKACVHDGTAAADTLRFLDLEKRRAGVAYGEEKLRVLVKAGCAVTPIHADQSLHS